MRKIFLFVFTVFVFSFGSLAQQTDSTIVLRNGDLLFQHIVCGELCEAIEQVTEGYQGHDFSHIGLVLIENDSVFILEAIGSKVQKNTLAAFKKRSTAPLLVARIKPGYAHITDSVIAFAKAQLGVPYDDAFLYDNQKYYCSELLYDAFKYANHNKPFFKLEPMTFKQPGKHTFFPAWVTYYKELGMPVPEGKPGINPGGISRSEKLDMLGWISSLK